MSRLTGALATVLLGLVSFISLQAASAGVLPSPWGATVTLTLGLITIAAGAMTLLG